MNPKPAEPAPPSLDQPCPCGSGKTFGQCCEPLLSGSGQAENAEQLMRSRFTAHVVRDFRHLHRTYQKTSQEPYVPDPEAGGTAWTRLEIHAHQPGPRPDQEIVEFTAFFKEGDQERSLIERAEFQKINGTWLYTRAIRQGPAPVKLAQAKVGRNDPCPCGSGKKYKKCHGQASG